MWRFASAPVLAAIVLGALCHSARAEVRYASRPRHLGRDNQRCRAVNAAGDVVGLSTIADSRNHAFLYRNGVMTDLGVPFGS